MLQGYFISKWVISKNEEGTSMILQNLRGAYPWFHLLLCRVNVSYCAQALTDNHISLNIQFLEQASDLPQLFLLDRKDHLLSFCQ